MNGNLMASCVRNNHTKNYKNMIIVLQVTVEMSGMILLRHSVYRVC